MKMYKICSQRNPTVLGIWKFIAKVRETDFIVDAPRRERSRTVRTPENAAAVAESERENTPTYRSSELSIPRTILRQILRKDFALSRNLCNMVDAKLAAVPSVEIDKGIFKYVLIKVYDKETPESTKPSKLIVRGYGDCQWHNDIYERVSTSCGGLGLDTECLGGGRIDHNPESKRIKVYGYSQGYGKADHAESRKVLLTNYPNYDIEISDEGY